MRTYKEEQSKILILDKIICNGCGKQIENKNYEKSNLYHNIKIEFGYPSNNDGDVWKFDLCEDCIKEMVENFVISVTKEIDFTYG